MLVKWKPAVYNGKSYRALVISLSNTFDCLTHEHARVKLRGYRFRISGLRLVTIKLIKLITITLSVYMKDALTVYSEFQN